MGRMHERKEGMAAKEGLDFFLPIGRESMIRFLEQVINYRETSSRLLRVSIRSLRYASYLPAGCAD